MTMSPRGFERGMPRDAHRVLVGIAAAQREEHAPALEPGDLEQALGKRPARLGAPGGGHEGELVGLCLDRRDQLRVLVAEVAALDQARHVEDLATVLEEELRAAAAHDRRGVPVPRHAPAVQHEIAFVRHPDIVSNPGMPGDYGDPGWFRNPARRGPRRDT